MAENLELEQAQAQIPAPKAKPKTEKIKLKLTGAASCNFDNYLFKKGEIIEVDSNRAERIFSTGLFTRI